MMGITQTPQPSHRRINVVHASIRAPFVRPNRPRIVSSAKEADTIAPISSKRFLSLSRMEIHIRDALDSLPIEDFERAFDFAIPTYPKKTRAPMDWARFTSQSKAVQNDESASGCSDGIVDSLSSDAVCDT